MVPGWGQFRANGWFAASGCTPTGLAILMSEQGRAPDSDEARLQSAREAARYEAWRELFAHFDEQQRERLARLLAHKWHIGGVVLRNTEGGRDYAHTVLAGDSGENEELSAAVRDVLGEFKRRTTSEGRSVEDDDALVEGELAGAAGCYAMNYAGSFGIHDYTDDVPMMWPQTPETWRPTGGRRDLVQAAAWLLAEIERLDRLAGREGGIPP